LQFEVAARGEGVEGFLEDVARVAEAGEEGAAVDEGEFFVEGPGVFGVVDLESTVGWDAGLLVMEVREGFFRIRRYILEGLDRT